MDFRLATCRRLPRLTPDDELLRLALQARGAHVEVAPWDAIPSDQGAGPVVCLRSTWDYHRRWTEFREWVGELGRNQGRLWNPADTVLWNADKIYLRELARAGVPIPETRWSEPGARPDWEVLLRDAGRHRAVLKPRVSATAHGTYLVEPGRRLSDTEWGPLEAFGALVQAFVPEILDGESSLVFIDGGLSHAVHKRPAADDFRVQGDFGGRIEPLVPDRSLTDFAERVLAAVRFDWVYARVDLVRTAGGPMLMELELIEPDLFLGQAPAAADRLAAALLRRAAHA